MDDNRSEWDRGWTFKTQRFVDPNTIAKSFVPNDAWELVSATVSENPAEFAERVHRVSDNCPLCGHSTDGAQRVAASLNLTYDTGLKFGVGVWLHKACIEGCPDTGEPAPIPW